MFDYELLLHAILFSKQQSRGYSERTFVARSPTGSSSTTPQGYSSNFLLTFKLWSYDSRHTAAKSVVPGSEQPRLRQQVGEPRVLRHPDARLAVFLFSSEVAWERQPLP